MATLAAALAIPIGAAVLWTGYYNNLRFGSPFEDSYPGVTFSNPLLDGVQRQLLSPGKGFFWYDPILLAALPGLVWLVRRDRALGGIIIGLSVLRVLVFAKWPFPDGSIASGPRFLLPGARCSPSHSRKPGSTSRGGPSPRTGPVSS